MEFKIHKTKTETHRIYSIFGIKFKFKLNTYIQIKKLRKEIKNCKKDNILLRKIIEQSIDITKIPPARGKLREVQLAKVEILRIANSIFEKHKIVYWLDFGTLIGAIRHKGFIPWDDDIDICMLKEDYLKLPKILNKELENTPLEFRYGSDFGYQIIKIYYKGYRTIDIDIFPFEYINERLETKEEKGVFLSKWIKIKKAILKKYPLNLFEEFKISHFDIIQECDELKNKVFGCNYKQNPETNQLVRCVETMTATNLCAVFEHAAIFPLKTAEFENLKLPMPNDPLEHLFESGEYGKYGSVMNFPTVKDSGFWHVQNHYEDIDFDFKAISDELKNISKNEV